jgi:crotonobetainyl-CoA:carnitine CoA-transferase CaiB-like acyl-CoA transferase
MGRSGDGGGPLNGLRVVDLSPTAVGAQATQTLADFGADVIWVEPPGGAALRSQASFPFLARGKRSLVADLKTAEGVERVRALAVSADVFLETFRPGVADRLGLGYEDLSGENPGLIYTSITGFGRRGPWARLKGYEGVVASVLGLQASFDTMFAGSHPPFVSVPWCSFPASQTALHGILTALLERERSGHGQWVETNLAQALATLDPWMWFLYLVTERWPGAYSPESAVTEKGNPNSYSIFVLLISQTKDGPWLQFAQNSTRLFAAMMRALGLEWMLTDPKWDGIPFLDDEEQRRELWVRMLEAAKEKTLGEWEQIFANDHDVFAELYRTGPEVLDHPQLVHGQRVIEIADPERGPVRQPGPLVRMASTPAVVGPPAPTLGGYETLEWRSPEGRALSPPQAEPPHGRLPLEGVTILELAVLYAAPYGATLLTDLGARVIKIEQLEGDPARPMAGFPEAGAAKSTQGKESVAVNIATPEGVEIVHQLAARVDAVLEGFRDGAAKRHHVDGETLLRINPNLICLSARGYGVGGPCGDRPAFAPTFGAAAGIAAAHLGRPAPNDPSLTLDDVREVSNRLRGASSSRYAQADGFSALGVATSLLLGLLARERGAGGQELFTSMLETTTHAMADYVVDYGGSPGGMSPGEDMRGPNALYRIYDTNDGWVFLAAPQPGEWDALVRGLGPYVDLRGDPRFSSVADRVAHDPALTEVLAGVFRTRGKDSWQDDLTAADVACVAVTTGLNEPILMAEEYGRASGYIADVHHPTFDDHPRLAPVVRFSRSATQAKPGTLCGTATESVLHELGYSDEQISDLRGRGVIG